MITCIHHRQFFFSNYACFNYIILLLLAGLYFLSILFQVSIPAWFTVETRLGSLSVHLDTPQCFSAEMYSQELNIVGKSEDDKVNEFILKKQFTCPSLEFLVILFLLPSLWYVIIGCNN